MGKKSLISRCTMPELVTCFTSDHVDRLHLGSPRKIHYGQKIHISVIDGLQEYHPKARLPGPQDVNNLWDMLRTNEASQHIWKGDDDDAFVRPLVADFVQNKADNSWETVRKMASSGMQFIFYICFVL